MTLDRRLGSALVVTLLGAPFLSAQPVLDLRLLSGSDLSAVEFSRIAAVRELSDRRVLVADAVEKQLFVVDFDRGSALKLGRQGDGPGEYRRINHLLPLTGDSSLIVDVFGRRLLLMAGTAFGAVIPSDAPFMKGGGLPRAADTRGHVLQTTLVRNIEGFSGTLDMRADSLWILRTSRKTGATDTLGKVKAQPSRVTTVNRNGGLESVSIVVNPLSVGEHVSMFADGAVAIARLNPYRVDWITATGRLQGPALPFENVPVSRDEKIAALARLPRTDERAKLEPEAVLDWPELVPPFLNGGVLAGSDGRLWVRRAPSLRDSGTRYDVIGRDGKLFARLKLPPNQLIVGFGADFIYVVTSDADDLQRVSRFPLRVALPR